jgi:hypothetical protein
MPLSLNTQEMLNVSLMVDGALAASASVQVKGILLAAINFPASFQVRRSCIAASAPAVCCLLASG